MLPGYWQEIIENHPVLTAQEERETAAKRDAATTDEERAKHTQKLVMHNLRAAVQRLRVMHAKECDQGDLMQEMVIGLMKAAERWQPMRDHRGEARFVHYAFLYLREGSNKGARKLWKDEVSLDAEKDEAYPLYEPLDTETDEQNHSLLDLTLLERLTRAEREVVKARILEVTLESDDELAARLRRKPHRVTRLLRSGLLKLTGRKPISRAGGVRPGRRRHKRDVKLSLCPQVTGALREQGVNISGLVGDFLGEYCRKHNLHKRPSKQNRKRA